MTVFAATALAAVASRSGAVMQPAFSLPLELLQFHQYGSQ
jgi:hypothetical protein